MRPNGSPLALKRSWPQFFEENGGLATTASNVRSRSPSTKAGVASVSPSLISAASPAPWRSMFIRAIAHVSGFSSWP